MKMIRLVSIFCLLVLSLLAIQPAGIIFAANGDEEEGLKTVVILSPSFPKMDAIAGGEFVYEIEATYFGAEDRDFDLRTTAPPGWEVYMTPPYEKDKKISAVRLTTTFSAVGTKFRLVVTAPFFPLPEPGEYVITLEAVSDDGIQTVTELTAVITARYTLAVIPSAERYNTTATVGEENVFSIEVGNLGTAPIDNITFSTTKPDGWIVEFSPEKIELLDAFSDQSVNVTIKPPTETIAGDYVVSVRASGKQIAANEIDIRVTVESPTIWGWVGVGIILVVIAGLAVIFMRLSRR